MNGFASMIAPLFASRIRIPSLPVSKRRRYCTSDFCTTDSARRRSVMSSIASRISSGRCSDGARRRALSSITFSPMLKKSWRTS